MEPELHSSVIEKVKSEKATLSGVISSLLSGWVSGAPTQEMEVPVRSGESISIQEVIDRIRVLEETVSTLTLTDMHQYESIHINNKVVDNPELSYPKISDEPVQPSINHIDNNAIGPVGESIDVIPPIDAEITNELQPVDDLSEETQNNHVAQQIIDIDPDGWYAQYEVVKMIDISIPFNTRKGWVSKAFTSGKLLTNGENGKKCRIKGASAIEWLKAINSTHMKR
jgi:hypothetical protein